MRAIALAFVLAWLGSFAGALPAAGTLVVNANTSDPAPRAAWEELLQRFQREHPELRVRFNVYDHESYKKAIRNWLTATPPDVVFWFAGHRMRQFVAPGLLEDVTELFTPELKASMHRSAIDLVSVGGRQFGIPYTYYPIGLFVRSDLLTAAGIRQPLRAWPDLLAACDSLKARRTEPIAIGTRDLWPAAAWFDYINLRVNGLSFHMDLMQGRVAYTHARVREVFRRWRDLVRADCFSRGHASTSWQESQALMYEGRAAIMLTGTYIVPNIPPHIREAIDFVPFPEIEGGVGTYEEAPINTLHVPARAPNKEAAKRFLAFAMRPDVQEALNRAIRQIPVHAQAAVADDRFLSQGRRVLARAEGLSQYFDRDTSEDLANVAMKGFQEFMLHPDRLDAILASIERARQRIYGPLSVASGSR